MKLERSKERQGNFGRKRTEYVEGEGREKENEENFGRRSRQKEREGLIKYKKWNIKMR